MRNKYLNLLLLSNALIFLDQYTKLLITAHLPLHDSIRVFDNFFNLTHIRNPGVAFGLFAEKNSEWMPIILILLSMVAIIAILIIYHQTPRSRRFGQFGLIFIFAGAIGNLIDRILRKEVIDLLQFYYDHFYFPTFNLADVFISVGVGLMIIDTFKKHPGYPHEAWKEAG